ncbi:9464_t:CDS:2, partial [Funneliformis caledonium]
ALPFVLFAFIVANVFGIVRLLLTANYPPENDTGINYSPENDIGNYTDDDEEGTIFPKASNEDIGKYEKQLDEVDDNDPVLIISPNHNWINQHTFQHYQKVMDAFATNNLPADMRRDENSLCIFHFSDMNDLYKVRENVCRLHRNAFFNPNVKPQQEPVGTAWLLTSVRKRKSDFGEDNRFFVTF